MVWVAGWRVGAARLIAWNAWNVMTTLRDDDGAALMFFGRG